jgi:F0F1-type ATP synthase assembly protein I
MKMKKSKAIVFAGMGFELVGLILAGLYMGQMIDKTYNLKGLATAGLSLLVLTGWMVQLVFMLKKYLAEEKSNKVN